MKIDSGVAFDLPLSVRPETGENTSIFLPSVEKISYTVKSDFMETYESGLPLSNDGDIAAVRNNKKELQFFSIGTDKQLYMISKKQGEYAQWDQQNITPPITERSEEGTIIQTFTVLQDSEESVVFIASAEKDKQYGSQIWYTDKMNTDTENIEWYKCGMIKDVRVIFMRSAEIPETNEKIVIACGKKENERFLRVYAKIVKINSSIGEEDNEDWEELEIPVDLDDVIDIKFGKRKMEEAFGIYVLGRYKNDNWFFFASFDQQKSNVSLKSDVVIFDEFENVSAFTVETDKQGYTAFFAATSDTKEGDDRNTKSPEGKYQFKYISVDAQDTPGKIEDIITIDRDIDSQPVSIISARDEDENVSLFAFLKDNTLMHSSGKLHKSTEENKWSSMTALRHNAGRLAHVHNKQNRVNEMFFIGNETTTLEYFWQDEQKRRWENLPVKIQAADTVERGKCITTNIKLFDAATGRELNTEELAQMGKVWIEVSEACNLEINGRKYFCEAGEKKELEIKPSSAIKTGKDIHYYNGITIIDNPSNVSTPLYRITASFMDIAIEVEPMKKIRDKFNSLEPDDMLKPTDRYGDPLKIKLLEKDMPKDDLKQITRAVNELSKMQRIKKTDALLLDKLGNAISVEALDAEGITLCTADTPFSTQIDLTHLPDDYCWSIVWENGRPHFFEKEETMKNNESLFQKYDLLYDENEGMGDWLVKLFGNIMEYINNCYEEVKKFIVRKVKDILELTVEIGGKIFNCAVKFLEQSFHVINGLLKKYLNIDLEKVVQWLGFIFNFEDIKKTQEYTAKLLKNTFKEAKGKVNGLDNMIRKYLKDIKKDLDGMELPNEIKSQDAMSLMSANRKKFEEQHGSELGEKERFMKNDPGTNWLNYSLTSQIDIMPVNLLPNLDIGQIIIEKIRKFCENSVIPLGEKSKVEIEKTYYEVKKWFESSNDMNFGTLFQRFGKRLAHFGIDLAEVIVNAFMELLNTMIEVAEKILTTELNIPIIKFLYKKIVGGEFTIIDILSLIIAFPATIVCKVFTGKAPVSLNDAAAIKNGARPHPALFFVYTIGSWCLSAIQYVLNGVGIAVNWANSNLPVKLPFSSVPGILGLLFQFGSILLQLAWLIFWVKNDVRMFIPFTMMCSVLSFDLLWAIIIMAETLMGAMERATADFENMVRSFITDTTLLVTSIGLLVMSLIKYTDEKNPIKIADSFLNFLQQEFRCIARPLCSVGNVIKPIDEETTIAKGLFHSMNKKYLECAMLLHTVRGVMNIIIYSAGGETDEEGIFFYMA